MAYSGAVIRAFGKFLALQIRSTLERFEINLAIRSHSLGVTPESELAKLLVKLRPVESKCPLIRVGSDGDGGYLIPDDLGGVTKCFSPGVDKKWTFEENLFKLAEIKSFMCDQIDKKPDGLTENQVFEEFWIGGETGNGLISLEDWINSHTAPEESDLLLQMDIEGGEYASLFCTPSITLKRFRIIVIELHFLELFKNRHAWEIYYQPILNKLLENFTVVHAHPNNALGYFKLGSLKFPRIVELTLHRNDRVTSLGTYLETPSPADRPCVADRPEIYFNWDQFEK